jgi:hypothetical protein
MAYKITQHRRGTYEEWLTSDVIPYEGELIIVEFDNSLRKCKFGDGKTAFSDLPYITDWLADELNSKIDALQVLTTEELNKAVESLYQKIEELSTTYSSDITLLKSDITKQLAEVSSNINVLSEDLNKVDGVIKTLVEPAVGELDAKYSEELSQIVKQHTADCGALHEAIESKANEILSTITNITDQEAIQVGGALEALKTELTSDYDNKIVEIKETYQYDAEVTKQTLYNHDKVITSIQTTISELSAYIDTKINEKVLASENTTNAKIDELLEAIRRINFSIERLQALQSQIAEEQPAMLSTRSVSSDTGLSEIIVQLEDLQYKVMSLETATSASALDIQNITIELSRLATSITTLSNQQKTNINNISTTITLLETKLNKADSDINAVIASHVTAVNNEIAKLTAADSLLYQVIYKIQDTLVTKLETSEATLHAELTDDITKINKNIADTKLKLSNQLVQAQTALAENLVVVKTDLTKKIDNLDKLTGARFEATEAAIANLSNSVTGGQADFISSLEAITADILKNTTDIAQNKIAINKLDTDLADKTAILSAGIDAANSKIDGQITNLENKLQTKLTVAETNIQKQSDELLAVQNRINNLIEDLDHIIADKILANGIGVSSDITELRNIINKIQADLKEAGASTNIDINSITTSINRINDELVDLAADDVILYQVIYKIRDELLGIITKEQASFQENLDEKINNATKEILNTQTNISGALDTLQAELSERINTVDTTAKTKTELLEKVILSKTAENTAAVNALATNVTTSNARIDTELKTLSTDVATNKTNTAINKATIDQAKISFDNRAKLIEANLDLFDARLDAQEIRIGNIVAFDSDTSYDPDKGYLAEAVAQEVVDARLGHSSVANALTATNNSIQTLRNSLSQYIDTQAIDGLHYDYEGTVGIQQPYMLYLKAGDEIIQDSGVQIISGSGGGGTGGGSSSLKLGYITTSPMVVTPSDKAIIYFTFSGTDSSGDTILQASSTWKINGITVEHGIVHEGENEFDVTKYLKTGTTKVLLSVVDDNGSVATKTWNIQQIELTLESNFNDRRKYSTAETVVFDYIPSGAIEKTVIFKLDGKIIDRVQLGKEVSGTLVSYELPPQTHGSHLLDIYIEAEINSNTITSNHKLKDILYYDSASTTPIIGTSVQSLAVKQYSTTNIIYTVYDPSSETPEVKVEIDGTIVSTSIVKPNKDYDNTPTDIYSYVASDAGAHTLKLICGNTIKVINVFVEDLGISIAPVTTGLVFDFNPAGKSNTDTDYSWSYNDISMSVSDNFDWINGGYIPDDPDGPCFCIKAGSSATIDYKLFANEAKAVGKEVKVVFKTKNVSNPDAVFLSCLDNTTDHDHVGLKMGVHAAHIYGKNGSLELAYSEDDAIEFEFNISKDTEAVPMVMGYEDGVPSRPLVYDSTYSFKQNTPKVITLGSPDCDLYIYRFKVYNTSLSAANILNNFIADARTADEMISRYNRNQIYDENQKLTAETLAEKCPWLRVYKVSAPHFTNSKSDKVSDTTIQQIYHAGDAVLDNWVAYNSQHSGQGTSSNNYGAAGRNLDFIMNKSNSYFELGDGTIVNEISLTRTSVPVAYLNAKVNIASSNNLTNAILANRYNRFNPYDRPFVREDGYDITKIKDTMEFYNCVIFIQETDPDLTTHREFADTDWHFYAIGNIGDSKKTDNTRLTDQNDPYECCVEIMDVGLPLSSFPRDTMINAMGYTVDEKTKERIYTWAKDENLGILYEKQPDGTYVLTSDTTVNLDKVYYVDILLHDDFSEDYTYGWRYISDDENSDVVDFCKQKWIEFYRFVTTSSDEDFKANLSNYFVVDSALYYYLFTTRYCMVDNRAKNTFWHYSKTADGTRKWDLCWDYDNDTSLGLNNFGKQVYRYGLEDIDHDEAGEEVFRQSNSLFFCRIRDLFDAELKKMYQDLESKDAWKASSFIAECDEWQSQFPEELWRVDIERKYLRTYNSSFINGKGDKQFLTNMANGKMKYHRRQWERSQEQYMASKYQTTTALSEDYHANFRVNRFDSTDGLAILPNYQFTLTPYSYIYLNVQYGGTGTISVRANPNVPTVVPYAGTSADIINVGSAAAIRDFGDLSALYPDTVSVQNATRVKTLKLGNNTAGYENAGFSSLTTGANALLEELDITNITSFDKTLDLTELINLRKLLASGTKIPSVIFAEGGKLNYLELPSVNDLTLKNLNYLSNTGIVLTSFGNVVDLIVEGCPLIDQLSLLETCHNLNRAKLDNINFGTQTYNYFVNNIFKLKGIDNDGAHAQITGTVHFENITGAQFNEIKKRYPKLVVTYDLLTSTITFKDTDNTSTIYEQTILNAGDCDDPVISGGHEAPVKQATPEFTYEWFGWSDIPDIIVNYETLTDDDALAAEQFDYTAYRINSIKHIEGNRVLYPVFKATRNSYEVQFINPTNNEVLYSVMTPYGHSATYVGKTPEKLDTDVSDLYSFTGWVPSPQIITGPTVCYAQFTILDNTWYTIGLLDITDCEDYNGNIFDGYQLNTVAKTMSITECKNDLNKAVKVPEQLTINGDAYTIVSIGGFRDHDKLALISLPETVSEISAHGFYSCNYLVEAPLSESITTIGASAFQGCSSLTEVLIPYKVRSIGNAAFAECANLKKITVAQNNSYYSTLQDGQILLETATGKIIQGLSNGILTADMGSTVRSLGDYCFANTNIKSAEIPESITVIPSNAFSRCTSLVNLVLPSTLEKLDATCFAWCSGLSEVKLPVGLLDISTYAFHGCSIAEIEIPSTVNYVRAQAFGSVASLTTVTFKKRLNADGTVFVPEIHRQAFVSAGNSTTPITFNVPWTEAQHNEKFTGFDADGVQKDPTFGANSCIFNFEC